jgi:hypothetical protein
MSVGYCRACGARVNDRYCSQCGTPTSGALGLVLGARNPWAFRAAVGLGVLSVLVLSVIVLREPGRPGPGPDPSRDGPTPPDISGLSPRQRFDTLYNVVMRASESGDAARAARFAPMAFMAYAALEDADADARYHAAVLRLHVEGDVTPALLLADTILASQPRHLFAYMIRGSAGQLSANERLTRKAAADFLAAWDAEIASGKREYQDHRIMLDQFRARALKADKEGNPP